MGVIMTIVGLFQGVIGLITFLDRNDAEFLAEADKTTAQLTAFSLVLMVFGVVSIVLGLALLRGSKLARMLIGIFEVLQIAGGIWLLVSGHDNQRIGAGASILGAVITLYLLFGTEKAKAFFA